MRRNFIIFMLSSFTGVSNMSYGAQIVAANHPHIQYFGRWDVSDPLRPRHSWPGVYLYAEFTGSFIGARLDDGVNYYNVYIDGRLRTVLHADRIGEAEYALADSLSDGKHTLLLSKRNTSFNQVFAFCGLVLNDGACLLPPPPKPARKIDFLGDSFTAAEGNEATEPEMEWIKKMPVTNIDQGFAAIIARHYGAQYCTTCRPGIGLVNDWQGNKDETLPKRFDRALMDREEPKWDFKQWTPDLVVICLGLNDYSGFGGWQRDVTPENAQLFQRTYHAFIATIRRVYPGVKIAAVAAHVPWIRTQVQQVVTKEKADGHADVMYAAFDYFENGYVANGHPTVATHGKMAEQIIEAIDRFKVFPDQSIKE
jgi:hypothetical protein